MVSYKFSVTLLRTASGVVLLPKQGGSFQIDDDGDEDDHCDKLRCTQIGDDESDELMMIKAGCLREICS